MGRDIDANDYILANIDLLGYYRVNYDNQNWKNIINQLKTDKNKITLGTRAQLINDIFNLSQATLVRPDLPLDMISYLSNEIEFLPWSVFLNRIKFYLDMLSSSQMVMDLKRYLASTVTPLYKKLGWFEDVNNDQLLDKYVKSFIIKILFL